MRFLIFRVEPPPLGGGTAPVNWVVSWSHNCEILEYGRSTFSKVQKPKIGDTSDFDWMGILTTRKACNRLLWDVFWWKKTSQNSPWTSWLLESWGSGTKIGRCHLWRRENFAILRLPSNDFWRVYHSKTVTFSRVQSRKNTLFYLQNRGLQRVNHPKTVKFSRAEGVKK